MLLYQVGCHYTQIELRGIKTHIQPDMPDVYGDPVGLAEVWQNLIDNAIKYMGAQSQTCIDIGIGVEPKFQDKVFGMFKYLDNRHVDGRHWGGVGVGAADCGGA